MLSDAIIIKHPLPYILELMEEAAEDFGRVFPLGEFFEETLENMNDKKYQTIWRLYDNMIHDPIDWAITFQMRNLPPKS